MSAIQNLIDRWETNEGKAVIRLFEMGMQHLEFQEQLLDAVSRLTEAARPSAAGLIDLRGIRLTDVEFKNITLEDVDFSFAQLTKCKIRNTTWRNSRLYYSRLQDCLFGEADVFTEMAHSEWTGCSVLNSYVRISFSDCKFSTIDFADSKIRLGGAWGEFSDINLERCEIYPSRTNNSVYRRVNIKNCSEIVLHAPASTFEDVNFSGAHFRNSSFQKSGFKGSDLKHVSLVDSDLRNCEFNRCDLRNAKFHNVTSGTSNPVQYVDNQTDQFVITGS